QPKYLCYTYRASEPIKVVEDPEPRNANRLTFLKKITKKTWIITGATTLLIVGGVTTAKLTHTKPKPVGSTNQTSGCPKDLSGTFTKSFVDPDKILALRPLGFTTGRDHILPVDHTGFTLKVA